MRTRIWLGTCAASLAAACSSSSGKNTITLVEPSPEVAPTVLAFQDGSDDTWHALTGFPLTFTATGDYQVVSVCDDSADGVTHFFVGLIGQTLDDPSTLNVGCDPVVPNADETAVTGTMLEAGEVAVGGVTGSATSADWPFSFTVPQGTYDIAAMASDGYVIQRAVAVGASSVDLGTLDASAPLTTVSLAATGLDADSQECDYALELDGVFTIQTGCTLGAPTVIPYAALGVADGQFVEISGTSAPADGRTFEHGISVEMSAAAGTSFAAPPDFASATLDDQLLTFSATGTDDDVDSAFAYRTSSTGGVFANYSGGFVADHDQLSLDLSAVPGFTADWQSTAESFFYETSTNLTSDGSVEGLVAFAVDVSGPAVRRDHRAGNDPRRVALLHRARARARTAAARR